MPSTCWSKVSGRKMSLAVNVKMKEDELKRGDRVDFEGD
jgi:hypothetical protein